MEGAMKRRDFLKGGVGLMAAGVSGPVAAQEPTVNPRVLELLRLHWCYAQPLLRRNINTLYNSNPNHPTIQAYRNAITVMKSRPASDPTSWLYQANIHGTYTAPPWPAGAPWSTCNHGYHFLSWHRMYLYFFERIVRAASGDPSFALPYWDYAPAASRTIPAPFRTPNNVSNALWDSSRNVVLNDPTSPAALPASAVNSTNCLVPSNFLGSGQFQQSVQQTPHNAVHSSISGHMGTFEEAGQDPIFWLHHCNIDRLWEKWLMQGGGRVNPTTDSTWMSTNFTFVDENKNFVQMSGDDVLYTINQLNYQYEDPRACVPPWWYYLVVSANVITIASERTRVLSSYVLARNVKPTPAQARIDLRADDGDTRERLAKALTLDTIAKAVESGARYVLVFEGLQTEAPLDGYFEVYLGLPRDAKADPDGPTYAGNLTLFGTDARSRQARRAHATHGDGGGEVALDVTSTLQRLVERGDVKNEVTVTLVPAGVTKSPNERFTFDAKASPLIGAVLLTIVKDE
jgi:tyrosinase